MENLIGYVKHSILNFGTSEMSLSIFRVIGHKIKGYFLLSKHLFQKKRPHQWGKCQKTAIFFPQKPQKAFAEDARIEKMRTFVTCKEKNGRAGLVSLRRGQQECPYRPSPPRMLARFSRQPSTARNMKRTIILLLLSLLVGGIGQAQYVDHRGHNIDSLQHVMATTPRDSLAYIKALRDLSVAYRQTDPHYAVILSRQLYEMCSVQGLFSGASSGAANISMAFRAGGQQDSALVWAMRELEMVEKMQESGNYKPSEIDNMRSLAYGNIGNIYCEMEDYEQSNAYFQKALVIFEQHGWDESAAVLYHNLGYLYTQNGQPRQAENYLLKSLEVGKQSGDSLIIATSNLQLGEYYVERRRFRKAMDYLIAADEYYSRHEDQEFMGRIELLNTFSAIRDHQLRCYRLLTVGCGLLILLILAVCVLLHWGKKQKKVIQETAKVLNETIEELPKAKEESPIKLNDREIAILKMLADGKDSKFMADELSLSLETVYWYRKRLLAKFDAKTMTEVLSEAIRRGVV